MTALNTDFWLCASVTCALGVGFCMGVRLKQALRRRELLKRKSSTGVLSARDGPRADDNAIVSYAVRLTSKINLGIQAPVAPSMMVQAADYWLGKKARYHVMRSSLSAAGLAEASLQLGCVCGGLFAVIGFVFSINLAFILGVIGFVSGGIAPFKALDTLRLKRLSELERNLPEMLETLALGLRSGLSFDRSFQLYGTHFTSRLAVECRDAFRLWETGLTTREKALRSLVASYNSVLFSRVIENALRALTFGSSLAEGLESAAAQARDTYRATVEEKVAKAPVKMMIPTGTLILPSMLLLVLGPVLLELAGGF